MIGASIRPSGRLPVVSAVTICSVVQFPRPVALSGVRLAPAKTPRPGIAKPTSEPPRYLLASGLPRNVPGVWQSEQPPTTTRYFPRSTRASAALASVVSAARLVVAARVSDAITSPPSAIVHLSLCQNSFASISLQEG